MSAEILIGDRRIGHGVPAFVIAEAGVNHNGDVQLARQLIQAAKQAGADCVKFQTFKAERVVTSTAPKANYQLHTTDPQESQIDMLRKLELSLDAYQELIALCAAEKISWMSTPYNEEDVDFLNALDIPAFKLASIHLVEPTFLEYVARSGKPMIISTGMATIAEIDTAVRAIRATGNDQIVLLQCTTNYPSRLEDTNLLAMQTIATTFETLVGYSDHTQTHTACIAAIALGACLIEKHFTIDPALPGPDQSTSANPEEFQQLVHLIRETETVLGSKTKQPCDAERINAIGMRRSIVAKHPIAKGEPIAADQLTFKRPATGIQPALLSELLDRIALQDIAAGEMMDWSMIGEKVTDGKPIA